MKRGHLIRLSAVALGLVLAGALVASYLGSHANVKISAVPPAEKIELAQLSAPNAAAPAAVAWKVVAEGSQRLRKGAYLFRLTQGEKKKVGMVAINDATDVVLK